MLWMSAPSKNKGKVSFRMSHGTSEIIPQARPTSHSTLLLGRTSLRELVGSEP